MPEIKRYEGKKKQVKAKAPLKTRSPRKVTTKKPTKEAVAEMSSRRPHHEVGENQASFFDETAQVVAEPVVEPAAEPIADSIMDPPREEERETFSEQNEKTHLSFFGSELLRYKAPKVMELADSVADEWIHDGDFAGLPVGNPLAQFVASKALRKAKDVEKKLEEKGVFMLARVGVEYVKAEINKRKK